MGGRTVMATDGVRWQVRRRWLNRPLPDLRRHFKERAEELHGADGIVDSFYVIDVLDNGWAGAALLGFLILLVLVLIPVLGVALELIFLLLLISSGLIGRVILRRPWTVEATPAGDGLEPVEYAVKGWRRSGRAVEEIARAIQAAGPPERISEGLKL